VLTRDSKVVIDSKRRVFVALVGQPDDVNYEKACEDAFECLVEEGKSAKFADQIPVHRRGHFPVINAGVSHAMGSTKPFNINNHQHNELIDRLVAHNSFRKLAGFASGKSWHYALHAAILHDNFSIICSIFAQGLWLL
jgi:hypothetical protein